MNDNSAHSLKYNGNASKNTRRINMFNKRREKTILSPCKCNNCEESSISIQVQLYEVTEMG